MNNYAKQNLRVLYKGHVNFNFDLSLIYKHIFRVEIYVFDNTENHVVISNALVWSKAWFVERFGCDWVSKIYKLIYEFWAKEHSKKLEKYISNFWQSTNMCL